jgi:hypothetical protein
MLLECLPTLGVAVADCAEGVLLHCLGQCLFASQSSALQTCAVLVFIGT